MNHRSFAALQAGQVVLHDTYGKCLVHRYEARTGLMLQPLTDAGMALLVYVLRKPKMTAFLCNKSNEVKLTEDTVESPATISEAGKLFMAAGGQWMVGNYADKYPMLGIPDVGSIIIGYIEGIPAMMAAKLGEPWKEYTSLKEAMAYIEQA